jgi:hypothetical protein
MYDYSKLIVRARQFEAADAARIARAKVQSRMTKEAIMRQRKAALLAADARKRLLDLLEAQTDDGG